MLQGHDARPAERRCGRSSLSPKQSGTVTSRLASREVSSWTTLLVISLFLIFQPLVYAQEVTLTSSTASTSSTTSTSSSSASPSSSSILIPTLPFNTTLPPLNASNPSVQINLPASSTLYVTLNICGVGANSSILPRAIISTSSPPSFILGRIEADPALGGLQVPNQVNRDGDPTLVSFNKGFGNWTWNTPDLTVQPSLLLALGIDNNGEIDSSSIPSDNGNIVVHVGVSSTAPLESISPSAPLLGDTTQNAVLLFSPLLQQAPILQPAYPNYTLPGAQLPLIAYAGPSAQTNLTTLSTDLELVVLPTASSPTNVGLDLSSCAIRNANQSSSFVASPGSMLVNATTQWMSVGGVEGYRTMWVLGGLGAETNYTAWLADSRGGLSHPIWFATKQATFPCQLALPNSLCPNIGYTAPLTPNDTTVALAGSDVSIAAPLWSLPESTTNLITASLNAFSSSLLSSACGRDVFSHISTCLDCYSSYRDWLCRITVPQCASTSASSAPIAPQTAIRTTDEPRISTLTSPYAYTELLPCLSTCNKVDRTCPVFLQFRCPRRLGTANASYAFVGDDKQVGDGDPANGIPAMDRWGNRWCNG